MKYCKCVSVGRATALLNLGAKLLSQAPGVPESHTPLAYQPSFGAALPSKQLCLGPWEEILSFRAGSKGELCITEAWQSKTVNL